MKFYAKIFEQLKEAGIQIDKNSPTGARLAIILIDNIFELVLFQKIQKEFETDGIFSSEATRKYPKSKRDEVIRDFKNILRFVYSDLQLFSKEHFDIINICHKMRNEAYHTNILRDEIVIGVSRAYFQTCCELLPNLLPGRYSYSYPLEPYLEKIVNDLGISPHDIHNFSDIISSISNGRNCNIEIFARRVSDFFLRRIDELISNLNYFQTLDNSSTTITDQTENTLIFLQLSGRGERDIIEKYTNNRSLKSYQVDVTIRNIQRWHSLAGGITTEQSIRGVLWKFSLIDEKLEVIERIVEEAVNQLDEYIDIQTEILMGK